MIILGKCPYCGSYEIRECYSYEDEYLYTKCTECEETFVKDLWKDEDED